MDPVKNLALFLTVVFAAGLARADGLSVKDWQKDVRWALERGDRDALARLTDRERLEKRALDRDRRADRDALEKARKQFAQGRLEEALANYDKVDKDSDYWLEAVEEKGWTYHRQNQPEKALAQTKTLLSPAFLPIVGSEAFFLRALTELKICDYKEVLQTNRLFKDSQKARVMALQDLASTGTNKALESLMRKTETFPLSLKDVGEESKTLPRLFFRDRVVQESLLAIKLGEAAAELKGLGAGKKLAGFERRGEKARAILKARMKTLAAAETEENFAMIQKLNLIEVETIQRLHTDKDLDREAFSKGRFRTVSADELVFPDDGHPWMDELDKFEVRADVCPQNLRRRM